MITKSVMECIKDIDILQSNADWESWNSPREIERSLQKNGYRIKMSCGRNKIAIITSTSAIKFNRFFASPSVEDEYYNLEYLLRTKYAHYFPRTQIVKLENNKIFLVQERIRYVDSAKYMFTKEYNVPMWAEGCFGIVDMFRGNYGWRKCSGGWHPVLIDIEGEAAIYQNASWGRSRRIKNTGSYYHNNVEDYRNIGKTHSDSYL